MRTDVSTTRRLIVRRDEWFRPLQFAHFTLTSVKDLLSFYFSAIKPCAAVEHEVTVYCSNKALL